MDLIRYLYKIVFVYCGETTFKNVHFLMSPHLLLSMSLLMALEFFMFDNIRIMFYKYRL